METIKSLYASNFEGTIEKAIDFLQSVKKDAVDKGYTNIYIRGGRYEDSGLVEFRVVGDLPASK